MSSSATPAQDVTEPAARLANRRGVHDRGELLDVIKQQAVEQCFVAVLKRCQPNVLLDVIRLTAQMLQLQDDLLLDRRHPPGQEPAQAQVVTFLHTERGVLVNQWLAKNLRTGQSDHRRSHTVPSPPQT
jgi:hypothetical protein